MSRIEVDPITTDPIPECETCRTEDGRAKLATLRFVMVWGTVHVCDACSLRDTPFWRAWFKDRPATPERREGRAMNAKRGTHFTRDNIRGLVPSEYRKITTTFAKRIDGPFSVTTREGVLTCPDGYLAIDAHGWPYPIAKDEFDAIYEPTAPPDQAKLDRYDWMVKSGAIDPDCTACRSYYGTRENPTPDAFAPSHKARDRCESGKRPHCTCDTCF